MKFKYHLACLLFFTDVETESSFIEPNLDKQRQNNKIEGTDMEIITAASFLPLETKPENNRKGKVTCHGSQDSMECGNCRGP